VDFTREPIIETVITPRDGYKIVVRSSKTVGQEEYFVDAVEIVSFGGAHFYRSLERPKPFLVPVSDYEVVETREARIVLKNVGLDRSIKIAGGKETKPVVKEEKKEEVESVQAKPAEVKPAEGKGRRDRRRQRGRKRPDAQEGGVSSDVEGGEGSQSMESETRSEHEKVDLEPPTVDGPSADKEGERLSQAVLSELLIPPPVLISETINRYRENALFQSAFYTKEELEAVGEQAPSDTPPPAKKEESESFDLILHEDFSLPFEEHTEPESR
jgi:hypothetical protein